MVNPLNAVGYGSAQSVAAQRPETATQEARSRQQADSVQLGASRVDAGQAQAILLERAYEKLSMVVGLARAELGIPEGAELDTSPEATANRIADFALGFFGQYAENNGLANDEAGRAEFAAFIGDAIGQGIEEARQILGALNALNGEIDGNIDKTAGIIQDRLDNFVMNGL